MKYKDRYIIWEHMGFCQIVDMEDEITYGCFTNVDSLEKVCELLNEKQSEINSQSVVIKNYQDRNDRMFKELQALKKKYGEDSK